MRLFSCGIDSTTQYGCILRRTCRACRKIVILLQYNYVLQSSLIFTPVDVNCLFVQRKYYVTHTDQNPNPQLAKQTPVAWGKGVLLEMSSATTRECIRIYCITHI